MMMWLPHRVSPQFYRYQSDTIGRQLIPSEKFGHALPCLDRGSSDGTNGAADFLECAQPSSFSVTPRRIETRIRGGGQEGGRRKQKAYIAARFGNRAAKNLPSRIDADFGGGLC